MNAEVALFAPAKAFEIFMYLHIYICISKIEIRFDD